MRNKIEGHLVQTRYRWSLNKNETHFAHRVLQKSNEAGYKNRSRHTDRKPAVRFVVPTGHQSLLGLSLGAPSPSRSSLNRCRSDRNTMTKRYPIVPMLHRAP